MIKPDGVQRGLVLSLPLRSPIPSLSLDFSRFFDPLFAYFIQIGEIISRFEKKGFYLKGNRFNLRFLSKILVMLK